MSHTKEPWFVVCAPWGDGTWINSGSPDPHHEGFVADCEDINGDVEKDQSRGNARRIVACVNACAGIPTDHLELCNAIGAVDVILKERNTLKAQRDELLSALESIANAAGQWTDHSEALRTAHFLARHTIASIKGGTA